MAELKPKPSLIYFSRGSTWLVLQKLCRGRGTFEGRLTVSVEKSLSSQGSHGNRHLVLSVLSPLLRIRNSKVSIFWPIQLNSIYCLGRWISRPGIRGQMSQIKVPSNDEGAFKRTEDRLQARIWLIQFTEVY